MTVLHDARLALASLLTTALSPVTVSAYPIAGTLPDDAVYLERARSRFRWRSLGDHTTDRAEYILIDVIVRCYRAGVNDVDAPGDAVDACEALLADIEDAVVADGGQVDGTVSFGRISRWRVSPSVTDTGWVAIARARLKARNYP
ncbi:MAG TPA: hypothetical protein VE972_15105 [Conexibacter sp.]|nr:hypothetical protein [Conexibacter sp.]